jgi:MFS-type transporter involved in bile tolerance (Atg22 family)
MAILLISYTIYNDTAFAIASVMSQLYILELRPGTLEISLYALAATVSGAIGSLAFFWIRPLIPFRLEYWLLVCYVIMILIPAWGIIGFAGVNFGFKVSRLCVGASIP